MAGKGLGLQRPGPCHLAHPALVLLGEDSDLSGAPQNGFVRSQALEKGGGANSRPDNLDMETGEGHSHSPCPAGDQRGFLSNICSSSLMATGTLHLFLPSSGRRQPLKPSDQRALLVVVTGTASPYLQNTPWPTRFLPGASEDAAVPQHRWRLFFKHQEMHFSRPAVYGTLPQMRISARYSARRIGGPPG